MPHVSGAFGDLLDPRFQKIFWNRYDELPDWLSKIFTFPADNGREDMRWSSVSSFGDIQQFTGQVDYQTLVEEYDVTQTHLEWVTGTQVERRLYEYDQYNIMDQRPKGLATGAQRTRQKHGARVFNNAFSVDQLFAVNTEGVALCSNSHTSLVPNVSTASGFDNLLTSALSATALTAARKQMKKFRQSNGELMSVMPDELWIPTELYDVAFEIIESQGKPGTANNDRNVHEGKYKINEWEHLTSATNWFLCDSTMRKDSLNWVDSIPLEFAFVEDFDTLVAKWRLYGAWSWSHNDWRWVIGSQVS